MPARCSGSRSTRSKVPTSLPPLLHPPDPRSQIVAAVEAGRFAVDKSSRSIIGRRCRPLHRLACSILTALSTSSMSPPSPPIYLADAPRRSQFLAHRRPVSHNGEI
ncbi:unnamed protein product [Linum trigynum]|uniref:Uncharacterized protein n=1 Tax=Linum trigynum TaxID=586398 RepID=A0AAV2EUI3_9ROSI